MSQDRIEWIDVSKGIVIILMVLGHSRLPESISNVIFSFHMPFFFIVSGLTTHFDNYNFGSFFFKKIKSLGIPFAIYSLVNLILWPIVKGVSFSAFASSIVKSGWEGIALWFIPVLIISLIMTKGILLIGKRQYRYIILFILPIISAILCFFKIQLPWTISVVPYATFFVLAGDMLKPFIDKLSSLNRSKWYWFVTAILMTFIIPQLWRLDMAWNHVSPILPITFAAFCGCFCIAKISVFITIRLKHVSGVLQTIGRETFIILSFSQIIICLLNHYYVMNVVWKYAILTVALILLCQIKDLTIKGLKKILV